MGGIAMVNGNWTDHFTPSGKVTVLCGAGISLDSGLPLAFHMLDFLFTRSGFDQTFLEEYKALRLPFEQWMQLFLSSRENGESLLSLFSAPELKPNINHRILARLAAAGVVKDIYTANFDCLIEQALEDEGLKRGTDFQVFYREEQFAAIENCNSIKVVKFHGSAEDPSSIRITLNNIISFKKMEQRTLAISPIFRGAEQDSLFIFGYSCSDVFDVLPVMGQQNPPCPKIFYASHCNQDPITAEAFSKDWPLPSYSYCGFHLHGHTSQILKDLCEFYGLAVPQSTSCCPPLSPDILLQKYSREYFDHFYYEEEYLVLRSRILLQCRKYEQACQLLEKAGPVGTLNMPAILNLSGQLSLASKEPDRALAAFQAEAFIHLEKYFADNPELFTLFLNDSVHFYSVIFDTVARYPSLTSDFYDEVSYIANTLLGKCAAALEAGDSHDVLEKQQHMLLAIQNLCSREELPLSKIQRQKLLSIMLYECALTYDRLGDVRQAEPLYLDALNLSRNLGHIRLILSSENALSAICLNDGNYKRALSYAEDACDLCRKYRHIPLYIQSVCYLLMTYVLAGNIEQAQKSYNELESLLRDNFEHRNILEDFLPFFLSRCTRLRHLECLVFLVQLLDKHFSSATKEMISSTAEELLQSGIRAQSEGNYPQARSFYQLSGSFYVELSDGGKQREVLYRMGILLELMQQEGGAFSCYQAIVQDFPQPSMERALSLFRMGTLLAREGRDHLPAAKRHVEMARDVFHELGEESWEKKCILQLKLYDESGFFGNP